MGAAPRPTSTPRPSPREPVPAGGRGDLECSAQRNPHRERCGCTGRGPVPRVGTGAMLTSQESFKRRIRARMRTTGERYGAARRAHLERADRQGGGRRWVAEPDLDDAAVREKTGRGWDEWVDLI